MKNSPSRKHLDLLQDARKQVIKLVADANYTVFYLGDGKSAVMSYSLKNYQNYLNYPFVRVSKSCIVNLHFLESFCTENKKIQLKDGSEIRVSRRRFEEVCRNISNF
ncbi:MAG: LytTR family transcriptional regulator DNA-binding domain-containing protein [Spirosomataceae bacterium]